MLAVVDVHLLKPTVPAQNSLYFWWNSSMFSYYSASTVNYEILASNCGRCPTTRINHTYVVCTDVPIDGEICNFTVETYVCGHYIGSSKPYLVQLENSNAGHDSVLLPILTAGILFLLIILVVGATVFLWFLYKWYRTSNFSRISQ